MTRFVGWLRKNADGFFALLLALTVGLLGVLDVLGAEKVGAATLLILALIAATLLRDRYLSLREVSKNRMVSLLNGIEIGQAHATARRNTEIWWFKGGTGTYLRASTLPICVETARREQRPLRMQLEILDPADEPLCKTYAQFRSSLAPAPDRTGETWTTDRTRKEAFATVLAACWYRQRFTFLTVEIGLSKVMSTFRWDLSSSCVIMTQDNANTPALMFEQDKPHYRDFSRDLVSSFKQTRKVQLSLADDLVFSDEPTIEETKKLFSVLDLPLPASFSDRDVADIVRKALRPRNPYE
ncbi:hypothetical protein D5S17_11295 [Pseudonocardiaceae bacterium YIM PH 21723]|nr:hypothetical protein D5S17_11295 [Pseudonocardiaceae bacterium YIM PH 21723]